MAKITEKEHIMTQEELEEPTPAEPTPDSEPEEPTEPTEPNELGITLPDDAAAVEEVSSTDRLLGFDNEGNPTTATATQVADYVHSTLKEASRPLEEVSAADRVLGLDMEGAPTAVTVNKLAAYAHSTAPKAVYRNLCMNSRGDNLNGWTSATSRGELYIDTDKFGYPVIRESNGVNHDARYSQLASTGNGFLDNYPELLGLCKRVGGQGLDQDITISYDLYPTLDCNTVYRFESEHPAIIIPTMAGRWNHIIAVIPAGSIMDYLKVVSLEVDGNANIGTDVETAFYVKNIQIEWGDTATPYTYNPTIPYSLEEQAVPGEFFPGNDGVWKQVYRRTFQFQTDKVPAVVTLMTGVERIVDCSAIMNNSQGCYYYEDTGNTLMWSLSFGSAGILAIRLRNIYQLNRPLFVTIDYIKR
ncbi:hypothetical protein [uncultured Rikenella sp.]|uniref:hypothetical protein n=1 Tax=uncultured Rikenella sp. TaxID=368003 RepID=UPI00262D7263|nr:hypothetical protein [uncultured Rikenella sp.]